MQNLPLTPGHFQNTNQKISDFLNGEEIPHKIGSKLVLNKSKGDGHLNCAQLNDGISMIAYDIKLKDGLDIHVDTSIQNPVYFLYVLNGSVKVKFFKKDHAVPLEPFQSMIISSCKTETFQLQFSNEEHLKFFVIQLDRKKYIGDRKNLFASKEMLSSMFADCNPAQTYVHRCSENLQIADMMSKLFKNTEESLAESFIIDGEVRIMLGSIIKQYLKDTDQSSLNVSLTLDELQRVQELACSIRSNPGKNYCIKQMTTDTGLNPLKLQEAFKHLFNRTAADYIRNVRVEKAEELLKTTDFNVSEVVYAIGLNSKSYFSKIFKEKYNCSPKSYQDKAKRAAVAF